VAEEGEGSGKARNINMGAGQSRATAGPGEKFSQGPFGEKILDFFLKIAHLWCTLYF